MIFGALPATGPLLGAVRVPGDKSISHRAVLFAAMADGTSRLAGVLDSADVRSTLGAVSALGATVSVAGGGADGLDVTVAGWGSRGPQEPPGALDCGNSGTTCRLLMGVLAPWPITVVLDGDESLRKRPMRRVTDPLTSMGARFDTRDGRLPVTVHGAPLRALRYESPVASAQVKTAVLLAGLGAQGVTTVIEPAPSRDHTERLLPAFGVGVTCDAAALSCSVTGPTGLEASDVAVPADPSSAAFIVGAALLVPGSDVILRDVALNPTRTGFLRVLERMCARVTTTVERAAGAEPTGTVEVTFSGDLRATTVSPDEAPSLIDEIPLLAVVACSATGVTRFEGVRELRVKESDRLEAIAEGLGALGATVRSGDDWLEVEGPTQLHGGTVSSLGDHRLAMAWAVAALAADAPVEIPLWEAVDVSYPGFASDLAALVRT
ncbi:MAG TPA: 3-phosphoshikimate 1-carboxyvinyltransferase [Coriobacteriia bacterium]